MDLAALDGIEVEYELRGSGEPVVVIHWGVSARWAEPLLAQPILAERYRVLRYHRVGFGGSSRVEGPISMADHAEHCRLLLQQLGIERAHVVGHSSSALIALQLALDAPDAVQSLALMDAARPAPATDAQAAFVREVAAAAIGRYRAGDVAGAVDIWARGVFGAGYRAPLDRGLPGVFEEILTCADTFFARSCRLCSSGRSPRPMRAASHNPSLPSSARTALRHSVSGGTSCLPGCRGSSRSTSPAPRTFFTSSARTRWPRVCPRSSRDTPSNLRAEIDVASAARPPH
jgi:pimeloyl-ACP methyl ester carboxylesterase